MQPSVATALLRQPKSNGHARIRPLKVTKRSGDEVAYASDKIVQAVRRCFVNSCGMADDEETLGKARSVAAEVEHLLMVEHPPITVEKIQDKVEVILMAKGYFDAAKEYILYRENHRKLREEQEVDEVTKAIFAEGCKVFTGPNSTIQIFQAFDKFARFDWSAGRREVWPESVDRVIGYARDHMIASFGRPVLEPSMWDDMRQSLLRLEAAPAMRVVQMAGPALKRCQTGVYNCSFQFLREPRDLAEEMYLLCQGCGVGFSVEHQHAVDKWPRVKKQRANAKPETFVIPDTTEGWCEALRVGMETWLDGHDVVFDHSQIRPKGAVLKTKGGRASGPQPLLDCLTFARGRILARQGDRLTSLDLHDIACYTHRISGVGGVRRASGISLSDLDDVDLRQCKSGSGWRETNPQRDQANNSAVYDERPNAVEFIEEWLALAKSYSGERGIFNRGALRRQLPPRRKLGRYVLGCNPCGEIYLRHKQFCNLSIAVLRPDLSWEEVRRRVQMAAIWGTVQSTMTNFNYVGSDWKKNCEEERLLGVDLLGHMDYPALQPNAPDLAARLQELRDLAIQTNAEYAQTLGINASAAVTCGKPSGDSGVFFDCAPGFKPWHGQYFIRRARVQPDNPLAKVLRDQGVPCYDDAYKTGLWVLEFPCRAPEGALVLGGQSAIEQLEHWKVFKQNYTEHNPSVTIYVKDDEWLAVGHWVYANWDVVGGLSFLPYDGGVHTQLPFETISKEEYEQRMAAFPEIDWSRLVRYESEDMTTCHQQFACTSGACSL